MPLISVIIPTYNSAQFLAEAIDSVLAQTVKDLELLIIDDGSTDETTALLAGYGEKVRVLHQAHAGPAAARNRGIREAKGEFVAFLDADDLWRPEKLAKQLAAFREQPEVAMVITGHDFYENGCFRPSVRGSNKRSRLMEGDVVRNIFKTSSVATPTVMLRQQVLDEVGLFDEELSIAEDENMWMRIALRHRVLLLDEPLVSIRIHADSLTRDQSKFLDAMHHHLDILEQRYPDLYNHIRHEIPKRMSDIYFAMGKDCFASGCYREARAAFQQGLRWTPSSPAYRFYLWLCFLPSGLLNLMMRLRQGLKSSPQETRSA